MTVQSESSRWYDLQAFIAIVNTIGDVFTHAAPYQAHIPSFSSLWGFTSASETVSAGALSREQVDARIERQVKGLLRSYDGQAHAGMFALPKHVRTALEGCNTVITDASPLSVY